MEESTQLPPPVKAEAISTLMRRARDSFADCKDVRIDHILHIFEVRGFAFFLLMLSLLNIFIFMVPFISVLFGLPMILLSAQMVFGIRTPIFPRFIRHRTIRQNLLVQGINQSIRGLEIIERYIKPRLYYLSHPFLNRVHGLTALVLAIMVSLPIPLFNVPPSIALAVLAMGLLQRDGLLIAVAYILGFWCLRLFESLGHLAHHLTSSSVFG